MHIASTLRSRFLLLFMLLISSWSIMAQVRFSAVASSNIIGKSDYVEVEFVVENAQQIDQLTQPAFEHFRIVKGPIQSSGMSVINGAVSQYKAISFVLQPLQTGNFVLPGATASIDGKSMHSNAVRIQVTASGSNARQYQPLAPMAWPGEPMEVDREYVLKSGENVQEKIKKNLFVKVQVSKTSCYVGEPVVATYKLYSRLQSESRVVKHPSLNGFSVYDMIDPTKDASSVETVNGKAFTVHVIRKAQLIPLQAGIVALDPVEVENTVHFVKGGAQRRRNTNPLQELFDRFSDDEGTGSRVDEQITLQSKPVEISVKALPLENRPANFNGAVGDFSLESGMDPKNLAAGDAAILKLTLQGSGNLPMVNAPAIVWPAGIENYSSSTRESIDKTVSPLKGSKTFEYKLVAGHAGEYAIPAVSFSFFDPAKAVYKTIESHALNLPVTAAVEKKEKPASADSNEKMAIAGEERPSWAETAGEFFQAHMEWFFAAIILLSVAIYLVVQNRFHRKTEERIKQAAAAAAAAEALKPPPPVDRFLLARELMQGGNHRSFYTELSRVIWNALAEKCQIRSSELNKYNLVLALQAKGWPVDQIGRLQSVLNECETRLYTPGYQDADLQRLLDQSEELLAKLA